MSKQTWSSWCGVFWSQRSELSEVGKRNLFWFKNIIKVTSTPLGVLWGFLTRGMHAPYPELSFSFLTEIDKYIIENIFSLYERLHLPLYLPCPFLMAECGILKTSQTVLQVTSQMPVWFHQWEAMFEICLWSLGLWVEDQGRGHLFY